jgi:hypothetical protein
VAVEIENELFKQFVKVVALEIPEMVGATILVWKPVFVDELAKAEQEAVYAVVAVKLDSAKVVSPQVYSLDWSKPAEDLVNIGCSLRSDRTMIVELNQGCLDDPIRERRIVQVIPKAGCATAPYQVMSDRLSDEQFSANARDVLLLWEIAPIQSTADEPTRAVDENAGE